MNDTVSLNARLDAGAGDANERSERSGRHGGQRQRRSWSREDKARIVSESAAPEASISEVARRHGLNRGLLTAWRRSFGLDAGGATPRTRSSGSGVLGFIPVETMEEPRSGLGDPGGRIEVDLRLGRVSLSGNVNPALARSVIGALRGV